MTIETAIKKAIGAGWKPTKYLNYENEKQVIGLSMFYDRFAQGAAFLDPTFWQSLGKAMGWNKGNKHDWALNPSEYRGWLHYWHSVIDHLADGKTAEEFFEGLN